MSDRDELVRRAERCVEKIEISISRQFGVVATRRHMDFDTHQAEVVLQEMQDALEEAQMHLLDVRAWAAGDKQAYSWSEVIGSAPTSR